MALDLAWLLKFDSEVLRLLLLVEHFAVLLIKKAHLRILVAENPEVLPPL